MIGLIKKKNEIAFKFYYLWYISSNLKKETEMME